MADREQAYRQLLAAVEQLKAEAAVAAENQARLLAHNDRVVSLAEGQASVYRNLQKAASGKPADI